MNCEEVRQSLETFADGKLDPKREQEVETHLAGCASCLEAAERITNCSLLDRMNMAVYKAPPELKSKIRATLRKQDQQGVRWFADHRRPLAYAAVLFLLICALAWTQLSLFPSKNKELIAEAIANHSRSLMVSHLVDCASGDRHIVAPWFNGKLDYSPPVADLAQSGYTLVGGRVDILEQRPVAAIVYQHGRYVINLFVWPSTDLKIDMDVQSDRGYHFCGWNRRGLNFFCISEISASDLERFEDEVREHVNL